MMNDVVKNELNTIPTNPGVYLMYDENDEIIYIGKAKNLKNRVSQYFLRSQSGKVLAMVSRVHHYKTIITKTEKEAFILEMNLIQTHYPRYNILLRDDKHYPYIALKKKGDPILKISRDTKNKSYYYFGPFPTSTYAYNIIKLLNKLYPLRKCKNIPSSPCLYYHLGNCLAPCINKIKEEDYSEMYLKIKDFLSGKDDTVKKEIKDKMLAASDNLDFEKAKEYKELLDSINHITQRQDVEIKNKVDKDVFAYSTREGYVSLAILLYRKGKLLGKDVFVVQEFGDIEEQVLSLIEQYYLNHDLPKLIVANLKDLDSLKEIFDVDTISPTRGENLDLITIASTNARQGLDEHFMSARLSDDNLSLLEELGTLLGIKIPLAIELFDNSHLQGYYPVGAMVHFQNGEPLKKMYRKYNIESNEGNDDYTSMKEVVYRRYSRAKEENNLNCDLILTDGGLGQVHAALESINALELDIPVYGLYKNDKHQTNGLIDKDGNVYPISNKSKLFFLLMRMQDEVHRFAISFHKDKRNKGMNKSIYDEIKGIGNKRKEILKKNYPTLDDLKNASIEELSQILPSNVAIELKNKIKTLE